ncbi:MAG: putative ABC transporter ATP-binding protein [Candidatus Heimdallarchaeota archaeon LC_2]|nr:MAG: putative ABC transporter ATP-binding protein [Candidatus Heimdallarchaeota archaeon LC_2]
MEPLIKTVNVHREFQVGEITVKALRGVNLEIKKSDFVIILGASGSGKTTLLNQIGGIDQPTEGQVIIGGNDVSKYNDKELTEHRRSQIGWIFQFHNLIPSLTAVENVQLALEMMGVSKDQRKRSEEALIAVGLEDEIDRFPAQLSGGQQQRVAVARALVKKPQIIVADEPTGNLDKKSGKNIVDLMVKLCKDEGITFCVVTHDPTLSSVADRLLIMEDGVLYETKEKYAEFGIVR